MIRHFLKTALRIFYKRKMYSLISLFGLILAFTVSFLILIYAVNELSINREFVNGDRIYRVTNYLKSTSSIWAVTVKDLGPQIKASISDLDGVTRMFGTRKSTKVIIDDNSITVRSMYVDNDFFNMFENDGGNDKSINLSDAYSVVISQKLAHQLSNDSKLIGETLLLKLWDKEVSVKVVNIIDGFSAKSNIQSDLIMSMELFDITNDAAILEVHPFLQTFIMLKEGEDPRHVKAALDVIDKDHFDDTKISNFELQAFSDFYLDSTGLANHHYPTGDKSKIQLFTTVAAMLLLIAIINYTILATANALYRQKEFGIRKSFGSNRGNIRLQTLSESLIMVFIALPLSLIFTELLLPYANDFWEKELDFHILKNWPIPGTFVLLSVFTGLVSGTYLSFYVSKLNPTLILSGLDNKKRSGLSVRKSLIVVQIFIFVVLSSFSMLILKQMDYFQSKPLGYDPKNLLGFDLIMKDDHSEDFTNATRIKSFLQEINQQRFIEIASYFFDQMPPYQDNTNIQGVTTKEQPNDRKTFITISSNHNVMEVMKLNLLEGSPLSEDRYDQILLTETGVRLLDLKDPVGKVISGGGQVEISGIVQDFHFQSFRKDIAPLLIRNSDIEGHDEYHYRLHFGIRYKPGSEQEVVNYLIERVTEYFPSYKIEDWGFQKNRISKVYTDEKKVSQTVIIGVIIVIIISSMGLFALSLYEAERRIKEIAIRKINGATTHNLVLLLSSDFTKWVLLAFILACPISYYFMNIWLDNFIYQTLISWWIFVLTAALTLFITWLTISFQSIKAAQRNPVVSLRNE